MADVIRMPLLSDTMTEGKIAAWNKKVGDIVKADDSLADVETDKATMEVVPYVAGTLLYIGLEAGQAAKVNDIIAIIGKPGEDISSLLNTQASAPEKANVVVVVEQEPKIEIQTSNIELPKELMVIRMPLLSDTMTEGKIVVWNKNVGDKVKADDSLADVETDKATMEVVGYVDGTLLYQGIKAGEAAKINEVIAVVGKEGFDITPYLATLKMSNTVSQLPEKAVEETVTNAPKSTEEKPTSDIGNQTSTRIKASPLAKQIAKEKGINLHSIEGSGDGGRIVRRDLENISATPVVVSQAVVSNSSNLSTQISFSDTPLTQMRKIIAQRLSDSMFTAPHFYLKTSVEMDTLMDARKMMNASSPVKISINDMMIKACAMSLAKHPVINSSWMVDFIRHNHQINIGTAIALPDGLIVPVIKNANLKSLSQIAFDANELYTKARNKKIQPAEFTGNTFTISNLGMMDIDEFTAIINPPDACILAVGKIATTPVVKNGAVVIKNIMKLTLSCDHRVVDGAEGALFLQTLKGFLESPVTMLV
jgi:pyruvate dehydrogenase E2 component (dihydrolipoamide acetyltransferase)